MLKNLIPAILLAMTTPAMAEPTSRVNADPALWVVKDADTTIYLFGTIHLMKPEVKWLEDGVKSAFDASQQLVVEMLPPSDAAVAALMQSKAIDPDGPALTKKMTAKSAALYVKAMESLNLPYAAFEQFEPWYAATILGIMPLQKYGFSVDAGVEKVLMKAAQGAGKKITGLETMEEQLAFLDTLPEPVQLRMLDATVKGIPGYEKQVNTMIASWSGGKPDKLANAMSQSMKSTPELYKTLLVDRNARWAEWISKRMEQPGTVFFAVGAGHLAGKKSVQDYLKAKKLIAKRIPS
jgi:uncharacterized protein